MFVEKQCHQRNSSCFLIGAGVAFSAMGDPPATSDDGKLLLGMEAFFFGGWRGHRCKGGVVGKQIGRGRRVGANTGKKGFFETC